MPLTSLNAASNITHSAKRFFTSDDGFQVQCACTSSTLYTIIVEGFKVDFTNHDAKSVHTVPDWAREISRVGAQCPVSWNCLCMAVALMQCNTN